MQSSVTTNHVVQWLTVRVTTVAQVQWVLLLLTVYSRKLLPGRMGGEQITVQNLEIVKVDAERGLLLVKGAIPGARKSQVVIKTAVKGN